MHVLPEWLKGPGYRFALGLFAAALGMEYLALSSAPPWATRELSFAIYHSLASLLAGYSTGRLLPEGNRTEKAWFAYTLFTGIALSLPIIGALGLLGAVVRPQNLARPAVSHQFERAAIAALPERITASATPHAASGGILGILQHAYNPESRIRAVLATRKLRPQDAVPMLRVALKDPVDEVRLLAYALLDRQEKAIHRRLKDQLEHLATAPPQRSAVLHECIAEDYWELGYLGLAQGAVLQHVLHTAHGHAEQSLRTQSANPPLHFLRGRILLRQDRYREAQAAFERALALGYPRSSLLPYLAELAFVERRFDDVRRYLQEVERLGLLSEPQVEFQAGRS